MSLLTRLSQLGPITYFPPIQSIHSTLLAALPSSPSLHHPPIDHTTMPPIGDTSGERTPRLTQEPPSLSSRSSSPHKPRRGSSLHSGGQPVAGPSYTGGLAEHRKGAVPRTLSDMTNGNGLGLGGLGLGMPEARKAFQHHKDDALASPRRISTSRGPGQTSQSSPYLSAATSSSSLLPSMPTNEAYYSQPPSASTPRFRQASVQPQGYGSTVSTTPSAGTHRRHFSIHSATASPITKAKSGSPVGSIVRKIRKTASAVGLRLGGTQGNYDPDDADGERENEESMEEEDEAMKSNGMRVWYRCVQEISSRLMCSSYVTIDWIHDAVSFDIPDAMGSELTLQIKESSRVRRMRTNAKRSYRGAIANAWDRFQGWMLVTVIGMSAPISSFSP